MNRTSPKRISLIISIIASALALAIIALYLFMEPINELLFGVICVLSVFIVVYILSIKAINDFVVEKVNPIYKSIFNLTISEKEIKSKFEEKDVISEVKADVLGWAKRKQRENKKLKNQERYRKEFLGDVSHELKTPIFAMQGYISTLLDGGLEDDSINTKYLQRTEKSINRMISIVSDLENISELESEIIKPQVSDFDVIELIKDVVESQEFNANKMKIILSCDAITGKEVFVSADKNKIQTVLVNLIGNSIKYGKQEGSTKISLLDMGNHLLVEISDDGIGISDDDLPRIFERFYRTDKSRSREMGGTGLGLAIVKHIIEAHNQTINARSVLGQGTVFTFSLEKAL